MTHIRNRAEPVSPPKARLAFRVGVVGHRPNRLQPADIPSLTARLAAGLSLIRQAVADFSAAHPGMFTPQPPCLRAVTPLAEGTDRYFAREALRLGYELCCPFPFPKEEFENDFHPANSEQAGTDSLAEFNAILRDAQNQGALVTFELDGVRAQAAEAYAAAGQVVLNQSDLLVVVWDGGGNNKRGGTYETMQKAIACRVPVLWIDARAPHPWQLVGQESDLPGSTAGRCVPVPCQTLDLAPVVDRILSPPKPASPPDQIDRHAPDLRADFFAERVPPLNFWFVWKCFRNLTGSFRLQFPKLRVEEFAAATAAEWPTGEAAGNDVERWVNIRLARHYAWPDKLADLYADKYRSAFVVCYLFSALAVMLALLPHSFAWARPAAESPARQIAEVVCGVLEFLVLFTIISLVWCGSRQRWHDRWMAYRLLAELVRQLRFLVPLGGGRPFPRPEPSEPGGRTPVNSWMYWHLRSLDREVGLPQARMNPQYLKESLRHLAAVLESQIQFHQAAAERCRRIHRRLHNSGMALFVITFVLVAVHFILQGSAHFNPFGEHRWQEPWEQWGVTFFCAALPALGAALAAINHQGEFARIARRSRAMAQQLEHRKREIARFLETPKAIRSGEAAGHALRAAQIMVDEVLDWQVMFLDRPLVAGP